MKRALIVALVCLAGCSPSALRVHATTALVASQTLATSEAALLSTCTVARDSCADVACVDRVRADCVTAATAQDAATDAVRAYIGAVQVAHIADDGRVMAAVLHALDTATRAWEALGDALRPLGIPLPSLGIGGAL